MQTMMQTKKSTTRVHLPVTVTHREPQPCCLRPTSLSPWTFPSISEPWPLRAASRNGSSCSRRRVSFFGWKKYDLNRETIWKDLWERCGKTRPRINQMIEWTYVMGWSYPIGYFLSIHRIFGSYIPWISHGIIIDISGISISMIPDTYWISIGRVKNWPRQVPHLIVEEGGARATRTTRAMGTTVNLIKHGWYLINLMNLVMWQEWYKMGIYIYEV